MAHDILLVKVIMLDGLCTEYTHTKKQVSFCLYLVCRYVSCYWKETAVSATKNILRKIILKPDKKM